jgi:hypothetical protein
MVTVPLRTLPWFGAIVRTTLPLPVPLAPDLIVMNGELLTAVHAQVAALAPTLTVMVSPPPLALALLEPMVKTHAGVLVVVVVVVVVVEGVVELLEHAPANIAATSPILATAPDTFKSPGRMGRSF